MGRLTDDLLAMFGVKPSDRVSPTFDVHQSNNNVATNQDINTKPSIEGQSTVKSTFFQNPYLRNSNDFNSNTAMDTETKHNQNNLEEDKDCTSCQVIGSGTCFLAAIYVIYNTNRNWSSLMNWKRYVYRLQGITLALSE